MKYRIDNQFALSDQPNGPLVPLLKGLAETLCEHQYAKGTIQNHLRNIVRFSAWLEQENVESDQLCAAQVEQYLQTVGDGAYMRVRKSLAHLTDYLRSQGIIEPSQAVAELTPARRCILDYERYLCRQRGLTTATAKNHARYVGEFLRHCFSPDKVELSALQFVDVVGFVGNQAQLKNKASMKAVTNALRSFLRYVHVHDERMPDLAAQVPAVADWAKTSVPRAIAADQVERLLASVDRKTATGRRDYAILLLLARLGLRSKEVAFLNLDDIDWTNATLTVTLKGTTRSTYPLTREIGEAIRDYLLNGRPSSDERRIFLCSKAPFLGFRSSSGIYAIVRSHIQRAGIDAPTKGAHQFRHGLACEMLRQGASLEEIGNMLSHQHLDSTMIYVKVDISAMRTLALPWPGGRT